MAKQLTINDPTTGVTYTLEYTRKTVEAMEKNGFVASDVERKPIPCFRLCLQVRSSPIIGS